VGSCSHPPASAAAAITGPRRDHHTGSDGAYMAGSGADRDRSRAAMVGMGLL